MTIRYGANGMPINKIQEEPQDEVLQEILEVNPNKKKKAAPKKSWEWTAEEDIKNEEL